MITVKKHTRLIAIKKSLPLFEKLYPKKTKKEIIAGLKTLIKQHKYCLLVAYKNNEPVGITGITIGYLLYVDKFLRVSNLYIDPNHRNEGTAQLLMSEAEKIAKQKKCTQIVLDSYVVNRDSHKTYLKENFAIEAYHFIKRL